MTLKNAPPLPISEASPTSLNALKFKNFNMSGTVGVFPIQCRWNGVNPSILGGARAPEAKPTFCGEACFSGCLRPVKGYTAEKGDIYISPFSAVYGVSSLIVNWRHFKLSKQSEYF